MKVRVCYTVHVTDEYRRAICRFYGENRKATRKEVVQWFWTYGQGVDDDLMTDYSDEAWDKQQADEQASDE
jgi:hypothetical protein